MPEFDLDDVVPDNRRVVILQTIQSHHSLVTVNRLLLVLVAALMVIVFLLGMLLLSGKTVVDDVARQQAMTAVAATQNPALAGEITALKGQMFGLVSGSIESKLRSLEDHIKSGSVTDSLDTLHDLRSDVKILSSYSNQSLSVLDSATTNQQLVRELSDIKSLIFLTIASCGLMLAAFAGLWLRYRYRLTHQQRYKAFLGKSQ